MIVAHMEVAQARTWVKTCVQVQDNRQLQRIATNARGDGDTGLIIVDGR